MIASLQKYIVSIRPSYLALEAVDWITNPQASSHHHEPPSPLPPPPRVPEKRLSDDERNQINHSITKFIREYELSISNLASAEALRQQTQATVLQRKFPLENSRLWKWAQGVGGKDSSSKASAKSGEQARLEAVEATLKTVRENVLWTLRRGLEVAVEMQRGMVEKRIQDVKQQEIDMIRMVSKKKDPVLPIPGAMPLWQEEGEEAAAIAAQQGGAYVPDVRETRGKGGALDEQAAAELQAEMSQEQLQLVEEENQGLLQHYEDTLSKVQYVRIPPLFFALPFSDALVPLPAATPSNHYMTSLPYNRRSWDISPSRKSTSTTSRMRPSTPRRTSGVLISSCTMRRAARALRESFSGARSGCARGWLCGMLSTEYRMKLDMGV